MFLKKIKKNNKGVTLLELIVAVSLFSITILMATRIFMTVIDGQRDAIAAQNMQESIRYTFERISKEIRMAQKDITGSCTGVADKVYDTNINNDELTFLNYHGECVTYSLDDYRLQVQRQTIDPSPLPITLGKIKINNLQFELLGSDPETDQLMVVIRIDAEAESKEQFKHELKTQTSISSRYYE